MKRAKIGLMEDSLKKQFSPRGMLDEIGSQFGGDEGGLFSLCIGNVGTPSKIDNSAPRRGHMTGIGNR